MAETPGTQENGELEFFLKSLPETDGKPMLSQEAFAAARGNAANQKLASEYIEKIAENSNNLNPGSFEVLVRSHHLKLKRLVQAALTSAFFLGLSTFEPTKITFLAGVERGLDFVKTVGECFRKLTPTQVLLYEIIVDITAKNYVSSISPYHLQGTKQDIKDVLADRRLDEPLDFESALTGLIEDNVIKVEPKSNPPIYRPVL